MTNNDYKTLKSLSLEASYFIKNFSNQHRLLILCLLLKESLNVSQLLEKIDISQPALSQHLSKLRSEKILGTKKIHNEVFYFINNKNVKDIIKVLHKIYCKKGV
jgi:DNA-binding transcriptional ArsR family regulator